MDQAVRCKHRAERAASEVRVDHRKWLASKLNRNKYGDKIDIQHNVTMDIAPTLLVAVERLKTLGVTVIDAPVKELEG